MSEPIALVPGRTDRDIAEELKAEVVQAIQPLVDIMQKANDLGFGIAFNVGPIQAVPKARMGLTSLKVIKEF